MADGSIILDIEARDAGLVQTLAQARQYAAQTATGMAQLAAAILHTGTVSNATSKATHSLLSALNLTAQGARNLTSAFRQQQSGVLGAMNAMVMGAVSLARTGTVQLQAAGISWGNSLTNGLRSGLGGVTNASTTGVNHALNPWRSAVNSAVNLGYGVSSGIAQGMNSGNPLLSSAASQSAHLAKSAFSGGNWPSLGYQISAGIAQGIRPEPRPFPPWPPRKKPWASVRPPGCSGTKWGGRFPGAWPWASWTGRGKQGAQRIRWPGSSPIFPGAPSAPVPHLPRRKRL